MRSHARHAGLSYLLPLTLLCSSDMPGQLLIGPPPHRRLTQFIFLKSVLNNIFKKIVYFCRAFPFYFFFNCRVPLVGMHGGRSKRRPQQQRGWEAAQPPSCCRLQRWCRAAVLHAGDSRRAGSSPSHVKTAALL